ncbi:MAG: pyridoxamine 5'-phosphate oxidase family protein [Granulosicoccus sp.]|nr:pyridoxamine 5'-phosphate oxidase family protein [Granulosicoccus sp.]
MKKNEMAAVIELIEKEADMTIATVRPDGYPQATTVSYVNDGLTLYFGTSSSSQKAMNLAGSSKVSLTINRPYRFWKDITGVSMGGDASRVTDAEEFRQVGQLLYEKYPQIPNFADSESEEVALFRIEPRFISFLDYRKGFGHTEQYEL